MSPEKTIDRPARIGSALLLAANVLFFWPVLFHGRVFSSHRAARAVAPWVSERARDDPRTPLLADPASGGEPVLRDLRHKLLWNPSAAGGAPGAINVVQGFLSPFSAIPALLLPEAAIETGILFLKLNAGFLFLYLFLRRRGLRDLSAAAGAAAWGWSGVQTAWWLWMQSSVTVCLPLLLLAIDSARNARRSDRAVLGAAAAFALFLSGGYPFLLIFGAAAALAYAAIPPERRQRPAAGRTAARLAVAALLSAALLFPAFRLSARTLEASGQLEARAGLAREIHLPLRHLLLYAFPLVDGDPLRGDYRPLTPSRFDTFIETAVGVGPAAVGLALLAFADRRHRRLFGYAALLALGAGAIVYAGPIRRLAESLPLVSAGLLERVKVLVVFGLALASALGADRAADVLESRGAIGRWTAGALPFAVGLPLIAVAARIYPAVRPAEAVFRATPGIRALRSAGFGPTRFIATGWALFPDLAGPFGLEDVRGHLFFERAYRRLLSAADPGIYGRTGTLLISDARTLDPASPVLDLLGVSAIAAAPGGPDLRPLAKAYAGSDLDVFRRPSAFPRFFFVDGLRQGGIDDAARASRATLRSIAFVDAKDVGRVPSAPAGVASASEVVVESDEPDSFRIAVRASSPALLASSQKLFPPYWTARVDGRSVAPIRVDGLFLGVPVPSGAHVVEGRFRVPARESAVSAAAALGLLGLGASSLGGRATA